MYMNFLPECMSVCQGHAVSSQFMRTDLLKLLFLFSSTLLLLRTKIGSSARAGCSLYFWAILPLTLFNIAHTVLQNYSWVFSNQISMGLWILYYDLSMYLCQIHDIYFFQNVTLEISMNKNIFSIFIFWWWKHS